MDISLLTQEVPQGKARMPYDGCCGAAAPIASPGGKLAKFGPSELNFD